MIQVLQKGYRLGDRVLRPARVVISRRGGWLSRSTKRWASRRTRRRTRSRRRTASSSARCTRTRTPAARSGSRRCRAPTTCSPTPRSASSTTVMGTTNGRAAPGGTTFDFGDFDLGDIFGGMFGGGAARQQPQQRGQRGNDVEVEVRVSFEDALRGVQVTVPVQLELACHTCHGTGAAPGTAPTTCPQCNGSGVVATSQGLFALQQPCPRCRGMGSIVETPCADVPRRRPRAPHEALHREDSGRRQGRHAHQAEGQGRGRLRRCACRRPVRRHARRAVEGLRAARRRPDRQRAGLVSDRGARRHRRGADARGPGVAEGAARAPRTASSCASRAAARRGSRAPARATCSPA